MKIGVLKTYEIDDNTWGKITEGFNQAFDRNKTASEFKEYYSNTILGYTYHALAYSDDGELSGSTTIIPHYYSVAGTRELFGLSGGTYVKKEFRNDIFIYQDMISALRVYCSLEGMKVIYGVSNNKSFKYAIHFLKVIHLMDLNYYAYPVKAGSMIKSRAGILIRPLNYLMTYLLSALNYLVAGILNENRTILPVHIIFDQTFSKIRFKSGYSVFDQGKYFFAYKMVNEDGVRTAYIIDYRENQKRTYRALAKAVRTIVFREPVDLVLYIGTIHHRQFCLFKVPVSKVPKRLPLTYETLGNCDENVIKIVSKKNNWEFGLVNFDVR